MTIARCSQCQLPMTSAESEKGVCPVCAATVAEPESASSIIAPAPARRSSGFFRSGLLGLCLLTGSVGGFLLHPVLAGDDSSPESPKRDVNDASKVPAKPATAQTDAKALERAQELETLAAQLSEELEAEQIKAADAEARAEAARRELSKLRAASSKWKDGRVKELQALIDSLNLDLVSQKKELDLAKAREAAVRGAKPQDDRAMVAEALNKKLIKSLEAQTKVVKDAKTREDAARRQTEQVRQDGQRALEQERQQHQRALEQLRRDDQRTVEQVRQQLRQQELVSQKLRVDLEQQKRATEEAKRKNKS
jgi:hypothetical protein